MRCCMFLPMLASILAGTAAAGPQWHAPVFATAAAPAATAAAPDTIDDVLAALYAGVSGDAGQPRDTAGLARVFAIADEDLERENAHKTSAVHFLRFELEPAMVAALRGGGALAAGIDHEHYRHEVRPVSTVTHAALLADLA